jgi:hypothetical protein
VWEKNFLERRRLGNGIVFRNCKCVWRFFGPDRVKTRRKQKKMPKIPPPYASKKVCKSRYTPRQKSGVKLFFENVKKVLDKCEKV